VHGIGKVYGGGTLGQGQDAALGGKDIDLIREQVDLDVLDEFHRVAGIFLHFQQRLHPFAGARLRGV
jgi:hypothetical protein